MTHPTIDVCEGLRVCAVWGDAGVLSVRLQGELDVSTGGILHERLFALDLSAANRLAVDLSELRFCDSHGYMGLLSVYARARAAGVVIHLYGASPSLRRLADLMGDEAARILG